MRAYDKLPAEVRAALRDAAVDWATQPILTGIRRGFSDAYIASLVPDWDAKYLKRTRKRTWGPDYPPCEATA